MRVRFVVSRYMRITRLTLFVTVTALVLLFWMMLPGTSQAQGIGDGLSQLLGGGGLGGLIPARNSGQPGQSSAPIIVDRNTHPYTRTFSGTETTGSAPNSLHGKVSRSTA